MNYVFALFPTDQGWHVARAKADSLNFVDLVVEQRASPEMRANVVADYLRQQGYAGESVMLVVPSAWCLSAQVRTDSLPRHKRHESLVYRLEEKLPLPAEGFVADFITHIQGATGVCLRRELAEPLIE